MKEHMIQIAYNLLKARKGEAIRGEAIQLKELGFKPTLDLIDESRAAFAGLLLRPRLLAAALHVEFEQRLRQRRIPIHPGRHEPRATKSRPKSFQ